MGRRRRGWEGRRRSGKDEKDEIRDGRAGGKIGEGERRIREMREPGKKKGRYRKGMESERGKE